MAISDADFNDTRDFLAGKTAIVCDEGDGYLGETRLQPAYKRHGFASFAAMTINES